MTYADAVRGLVQGLRADATDYDTLKLLLERQFHAALRHATGELDVLSQQIVGLAGILDGRRRERLQLARLLLGMKAQAAPAPAVSIGAVTQRLPAAARPAFTAEWTRLEERVRGCKELNTRNCRLFMSQFEIMQRVLVEEAHTYAPA